ncbi:hypothetical protein ACFVAJ_17255 [Agromyces sp. NPDC057679]|uniref:hypothetical protein n=1 Tax=Agromyces sp. NPDC057679 TaxID=3346207 RepID=UPI0036720673
MSRVARSPEALWSEPLRSAKRRRCDGHLTGPHFIEAGDLLVWAALPPGGDYGTERWQHKAFCVEQCAPAPGASRKAAPGLQTAAEITSAALHAAIAEGLAVLSERERELFDRIYPALNDSTLAEAYDLIRRTLNKKRSYADGDDRMERGRSASAAG